MYQVAIFDDNSIVLDSLAKSVDWETLDCHVCGVANNGADAHRILIGCLPDIVISDIMIPGFTGLELVSMCREQCPGTKFIMITGFSNADFARMSVRLGVFDYIPKPIDNGEIQKVVQEAIRQIQKERGNQPAVDEPEDPVSCALEQVYNASAGYSALTNGIIRYIRQNFEKAIFLGAVAKEFGVSASYLSTLFKKETGVGFINFVTMVKLDYAKRLLQDPRNKVTEVGYKVGYTDYSYFYQVFKKYYGYAPGSLQR